MTGFFLISDWCAKIYEHDDINGWEKVVGETSQLNLDGNEDDQLTSVRIRPGCTLDLFDNWNNDGFLGSLTSNVSLVNYNDKVSSLSCTCTEGNSALEKIEVQKSIPCFKLHN